jgi:hypothetical protein
MVEDLCNLFEEKFEKLTVHQKSEIYIGMMHVTDEPFVDFIDDLKNELSFDDLLKSCMLFLHTHAKSLSDKVISISETDSPIKCLLRYMHRSSLPINAESVLFKFSEILIFFQKTEADEKRVAKNF